jgi:translocation and assembly module TamA
LVVLCLAGMNLQHQASAQVPLDQSSTATTPAATTPSATTPAAATATVTTRSDPAAPTNASISNYRLEIEGPPEIKLLIERQTLIGRWRQRAEYQPEQFDALFARLREEVETILRSQGYFDYEIDLSGDPKEVKIGIIAGARTTVNKVDLRILGPIKEFPEIERALRQRWNLPEGTFYNSNNWESSKRGLLDSMRQRGFLRAQLSSSRATADVANTTVGLELEVASGARLSFGALSLNGLSRYDSKIVEDLKPFSVGEAYDFDSVLLFQTRLRDSGYFSSAYVIPDQQALDDDPKLERVPLRVELTERETKRVVLGVGYSTDQGARAQIGLQHRDLFDRGWQLDSGLIVEQLRQRLYANVRTPTDADNHHIAFGGRSERQDIQNEQINRDTVYIGRGRRLNHLESFTSLQYQYERKVIETSPGIRTGDSIRALMLGYSWNYRVLDSRIDPRAGYTVSAQFSGALKALGSDANFARIYTRAMRFQPLDPDTPSKSGIFIGLLELGHVFANSRQSIPSESLFRAGGAQSLRGYGYQSIGVTQGEAIVGGLTLGIASLEYQHPIGQSLWLATFADVGNAVDRAADFKPLWGYGVGLRWRTPIGPINLDLAQGDRDRKTRIHFSVGYTF